MPQFLIGYEIVGHILVEAQNSQAAAAMARGIVRPFWSVKLRWNICHYPKHKDGNSDWSSDTLPTVQIGVEKIRAILSRLNSQTPSADVRAMALEEAAKIADDFRPGDPMCRYIASHIRALATDQPPSAEADDDPPSFVPPKSRTRYLLVPEQVREALEPFAKAANKAVWPTFERDNTLVDPSFGIRMCDLRRAREALAMLAAQVSDGEGPEQSTLAAEVTASPSASCRGRPSPDGIDPMPAEDVVKPWTECPECKCGRGEDHRPNCSVRKRPVVKDYSKDAKPGA